MQYCHVALAPNILTVAFNSVKQHSKYKIKEKKHQPTIGVMDLKHIGVELGVFVWELLLPLKQFAPSGCLQP